MATTVSCLQKTNGGRQGAHLERNCNWLAQTQRTHLIPLRPLCLHDHLHLHLFRSQNPSNPSPFRGSHGNGKRYQGSHQAHDCTLIESSDCQEHDDEERNRLRLQEKNVEETKPDEEGLYLSVYETGDGGPCSIEITMSP